DQGNLKDHADQVQRAERLGMALVWAERQAGEARGEVDRHDGGVSGDAQPQPQLRRPPQDHGRPDSLGPGDDKKENAEESVFAEMLEGDGEMNRCGAGGQRGQAAQEVRFGRWWRGTDSVLCQDRCAHATHARFAARALASARKLNSTRLAGPHGTVFSTLWRTPSD